MLTLYEYRISANVSFQEQRVKPATRRTGTAECVNDDRRDSRRGAGLRMSCLSTVWVVESHAPGFRPGQPRPGAPGGHRGLPRKSGARSDGTGLILSSMGPRSRGTVGTLMYPERFVRRRGSRIVRCLSRHDCRIELNFLPWNRDELRLRFASSGLPWGGKGPTFISGAGSVEPLHDSVAGTDAGLRAQREENADKVLQSMGGGGTGVRHPKKNPDGFHKRRDRPGPAIWC